ncbi:MAG: 6-carboxytetrahydropterin synthase [Gammaproteobacteria bacterium]|nr:6-carboxytetrahydropterin synthase [Gammaproteobacteria bacterium]
MKCRECNAMVERLDNEHLLQCCGLTVQEYAIRHQQPLDMLLHSDQVNVVESPDAFRVTATCPSERARSTLQALRWAGLLRRSGVFVEVPGEIRRLALLQWDLEQLRSYGFQFRQDYTYANGTHRVVARNLLRTSAANLVSRSSPSVTPPPAFLDTLSTYVAHIAEWHAGYLFMQFADLVHGEDVRQALARDHAISCDVLDAPDRADGVLLRTRTLSDTQRLMSLLEDRLREIPTAWDRFLQSTPQATVSKELVFDAAHFITDHPAKCSNLHGGRYVLQVQVSGRIDPMTGCVVDYGYLKRVVNRQVIERFDHHHLNYAAEELAWRSSTEMLCVHIWECLIEYLPGLSGLRLFETTQSWCDYRGPTLEEYQAQGSAGLLHPFSRSMLDTDKRESLMSGRLLLRSIAAGCAT